MSDYEMNDTEREAFGNWHRTGSYRDYGAQGAWLAALAFSAKHGYKPPGPPKCGAKLPGSTPGWGLCFLPKGPHAEHRCGYDRPDGQSYKFIVWPNENDGGAT